MCRFTLIQSKELIDSRKLISEFSDMAEQSRSPDGDTQSDGWGAAWLDEKNTWKQYRNLRPVWKDKDSFAQIPKTKTLVMHARSASFPGQINEIEFNQPYISDKYAFVFNGLLKGVTFPYPVPGRIGAQKIWNLLQKELKTKSPEDDLQSLKKLLITHTKELKACNIGLTERKNIYTLSVYKEFPEYYQLHEHKSEGIQIISSEPIGNYNFLPKHTS